MLKYMVYLLFCVVLYKNINAKTLVKPKILVIESYNKEYKWFADYKQALLDNLSQDYVLTFYEMDTKRLPKNMHETKANDGWKLINKIKPDLVILGDDAALKYIGPKLEKEKKKGVYLGINNNPRYYFNGENPKYLTGILERPLITESALYIPKIIPNVKNVLILFDGDITSEIIFNDVFKGKQNAIIDELNFTIKLIKHYSDWQKEILDAPANYQAIVVGLFQSIIDKNGKNIAANDIMNWSAENSKLPLFCFWDFGVGKNMTIGGLILSGYSMGKAASNIVKKLMADPNLIPEKIYPVSLKEGIFIFSKLQMQKWNVKLPDLIYEKSNFVE